VHFAYPLPWWLAVAIAASIAAAAFLQYRRPLAPLSRSQRAALAALRAVTLAALALFLFRPLITVPPSGARDAVVPVLVDASRSMRIGDADGQTRMAAATSLVSARLLPALAGHFTVDLFAIGDQVAPIKAAGLAALGAGARRTDLAGSLAAIRDRYRGQRIAGIVVVSDGGDTETATAAPSGSGDGPPVFAIGVGAPDGLHDREVLTIAAGDPRIDRASVDLHVSAVSHGFGREPFTVRVLANGRLLETRRIAPPGDGSPVEAVFTVSPDPLTPTVYTAEIPGDGGESVAENNSRSVLVSPAGRKRRRLVIEGAPGFEHSFLTRSWAGDPGLDFDVVTRKGKNAEAQDTFFVQAGSGRGAALTSGFPQRRDQLFAYDAVVIANVESDYFTRAQLARLAEFFGVRGGGLLVMGGRSFARGGLAGTPLEDVMPVELSDRHGGVVRAALADDAGAHNRMTLTADGEAHPIMRLGTTADEIRNKWAALPARAASAALGAARPGAKILALTTAPGGGVYPVVAVQRYGQGRAMIFAGEAAWRWKMMSASSDRAYDLFWRQAARWLSADAPDPVSVTLPEAPEPGDSLTLGIDARDSSFAPVADATVDGTLTLPGGDAVPLKLRHVDGGSGRFSAALPADRPGLYRVRVEARRGSASLGTADRWLYVGGSDREFADPRLNESLLRRVARASGGRYARAADAPHLLKSLEAATPLDATPERRDLWHQPSAFAAIILLLSAEWILRRRWGLR
jgi:uncharacterized membrane protein